MRVLLRPWLRFHDFEGRSSRTELIGFLLTMSVLVGGATGVTEAITGIDFSAADRAAPWPAMIVMLAVALPFFAVMVRRMHDQNKSGWFVTLALTGIGAIFLLIIAVYPGTDGWNAYGEDPRYFDDDEDSGINGAAGRA